MKSFILATAGHVDHGKSALVRGLTGTDPDRLPEEKARGITIELGFAHLELEGLSVGLIDVPGHEDFVKNMVAGVDSIHLALLVVAADDGWMPQTEEHLQILGYLGVPRIVVALTKIDLARSEEAAETAVRAHLQSSAFADAAIIRTSIPAQRGLAELKAQLAHEFAALVPPRDLGKPRLAVDRAFTMRGIGTVVTGTLAGGSLRRNEAVVVQPGKIPARIRAIQNHHREVDEIGPGMRTALSVPDLPVARAKTSTGIGRGDVITLPELGEASRIVDVELMRSARLPAKTRAMKHGVSVRVHHGSGNVPARVFFHGDEELHAGARAIAQLRFERPVFMFAGDRFVVRDTSEQHTLAGGVVLDPAAEERRFRGAAQRALLEQRAAAPNDVRILVSTQLARDHAIRRSELLQQSSFSASEISQAIRPDQVIERYDLLLDAVWWEERCQQAASVIDAAHRQHPNRMGLELAQLRDALAGELPFPSLCDILIADLSKQGFVKSGEQIARRAHRPSLPPSLQAAGAKIRVALAAKEFDPPSVKELAPDAVSQ